jgi:hypothetical protein
VSAAGPALFQRTPQRHRDRREYDPVHTDTKLFRRATRSKAQQLARSVGWRQLFYLPLGQAEPDPVLDTGHRADRGGPANILDRTGAPQLWCILDEVVLHPAVGGPKVIRSQGIGISLW